MSGNGLCGGRGGRSDSVRDECGFAGYFSELVAFLRIVYHALAHGKDDILCAEAPPSLCEFNGGDLYEFTGLPSRSVSVWTGGPAGRGEIERRHDFIDVLDIPGSVLADAGSDRVREDLVLQASEEAQIDGAGRCAHGGFGS